MISLRDIAACIGVSGSFSLVRDFFGYRSLRSSPFAPRLSLLAQVRLLKGVHIHLNFIRVGAESFTAEVEERLDEALNELRTIYAAVPLGVGRVEHYAISLEEAAGADLIDSDDEGVQLWEDWSVANDGIDVFLAVAMAGTHGLSPIGGSCDKDGNRSGLTVEAVGLDGYYPFLGRVLAHEIGHYLGLAHRDVEGNLMHSQETELGDSLEEAQAAEMRAHCMVRANCE